MWQHQILTTLRGAETTLQRILEVHGDKSRTAVSRIVCEQYRFMDAHGRPQWAGCLKALRTLEAENKIVLPVSQRTGRIAGPRLLEAPVDVPDTVGEVEDLDLPYS